MPAYGGPKYPIVQLLHQMWPRRSTIAELVPHCATPGEFSVPHHPEGPSLGSLKPGFTRLAAHPGTLVDRIVSTTTCEQPQEADCPGRSAPTPAHIRATAPVLLIARHFGRTSPIRFHGGALRQWAQQRATGLGRRSSMIARMRRNRSRDSATSAIWNTV